MTSEASAASAPPYVSFRTILNLLERLHEGGIPQRIDRSYWSTFLAGGMGGQLMVALRWLELVDPVMGEPTPMLERLVDPVERKAALAGLLRDRYAAVFQSLDLARTTSGHLDETFRKEYKIGKETLRKAVTFFVYAAQYAELPVSSLITDKTRKPPSSRRGAPRQSNGRRPRQDTNGGAPAQQPPTHHDPPPVPEGVTRAVELRSGGRVWVGYSLNLFELDAGDQAFVLELIGKLREYGQKLPDGSAPRLEATIAEVETQ